VERREHFREKADAQRRRGTDAHASPAQPAKLRHVVAHGIGVGKHASGPREQCFPGRRQRDVSASTMKQLGTELALQRRDLPAERRLRKMETLGGSREVAEFGDLDETAQLLQIHIYSVTLLIRVRLCIGRITRTFLAWKHDWKSSRTSAVDQRPHY